MAIVQIKGVHYDKRKKTLGDMHESKEEFLCHMVGMCFIHLPRAI